MIRMMIRIKVKIVLSVVRAELAVWRGIVTLFPIQRLMEWRIDVDQRRLRKSQLRRRESEKRRVDLYRDILAANDEENVLSPDDIASYQRAIDQYDAWGHIVEPD